MTKDAGCDVGQVDWQFDSLEALPTRRSSRAKAVLTFLFPWLTVFALLWMYATG